MNKKINEKVYNYKIKFSGRKIGSIGKFDNYKTEIKALSQKEAVEKLYTQFEHIRLITIIKRKVI